MAKTPLATQGAMVTLGDQKMGCMSCRVPSDFIYFVLQLGLSGARRLYLICVRLHQKGYLSFQNAHGALSTVLFLVRICC